MKKHLLIIILSIFALPLAAQAWPWSRDLMDQPSIKPQEPPLFTYPKDSVPVEINQWTLVSSRDEADHMKNPIPATEKSIRYGHAMFMTYCLPCHGPDGKGDGLVGKVFEVQPMDLTSDYVKGVSDGWIFGTITFGSFGIMPRYGYDMRPWERWDVVNYIRNVLEKPGSEKTRSEVAALVKKYHQQAKLKLNPKAGE
jgi:mono/diheme cytochrome c family protein